MLLMLARNRSMTACAPTPESHNVSAEARVAVMNTSVFLTISAAIVPDRVAIVGEDEPITYLELQSRVNRLAQALQALGIGKGANVGIMAVNSPAFAEIYYASAAVGATFVPL